MVPGEALHVMPMLLAKSFVRGWQSVAPKFESSSYQLVPQNKPPTVRNKSLLGRSAGRAQLMACYRVAEPFIRQRLACSPWSIIDDELPVTVGPKACVIVDEADQIPFGYPE